MAVPAVTRRTNRFCFLSLTSLTTSASSTPAKKRITPRIEFKDTTAAIFDGAKCLFKYYLDIKKYDPTKNKEDITEISVMDYYSKTSIGALQAFFVIWSDVYGPMGHEPIPFEKETDAKKFMKEHKGKKILRFKDVNPNLIKSLDNP